MTTETSAQRKRDLDQVHNRWDSGADKQTVYLVAHGPADADGTWPTAYIANRNDAHRLAAESIDAGLEVIIGLGHIEKLVQL